MFFASGYRKLYLCIAAALLFCFITGIIIYNQSDSIQTANTTLAHDSSMILIIDAGHGGADGGAVAMNGTNESIINLSIALKLNSLAGILGQKTLLIRDSEELAYPEDADTIAKMKRWDQHRRLDLINSSDNAVLISIHQNKYPDPRPFGPQVLYGNFSGSEELGTECHNLLNKFLCPQNRRVAMAASKDIYLMKNAACPAILVECGFISNNNELALLLDENYQKKLAAILISVFLGYNG